MKKILGSAVVFAFIIASAPAHAFTVAAHGGFAFPGGDAYAGVESPAFQWGGELTFGLSDIFQLGGFYQQIGFSPENGTTDSTLRFYGAVARVSPPATDIFVDAKLGFDTVSVGDTSTDSTFAFGLGAGYIIGLGPLVSLMPRVGYYSLPVGEDPNSVSGHTFDATLLVSLGF